MQEETLPDSSPLKTVLEPEGEYLYLEFRFALGYLIDGSDTWFRPFDRVFVPILFYKKPPVMFQLSKVTTAKLLQFLDARNYLDGYEPHPRKFPFHITSEMDHPHSILFKIHNLNSAKQKHILNLITLDRLNSCPMDN